MTNDRFVTRSKRLLQLSMFAFVACSDGSSIVGIAPGSGAGGVSAASSTGSTGSAGSGSVSDASVGSGGASDVSTGGSTGRADSSVADQKADVPVPVYEQDDPN